MTALASDRSVDPDAQAAVTDFLDYTEYLPSDLLRFLTLIRGLDEKYSSHANALDDLTKHYGAIPSLEPTMRPDAQGLRLQISTNLDKALNARESAYAEACRLFDVADRHQNRLKSIIAKLKAIPKPPSRDPSPQPPTSAQKRSRSGREIKSGMSSTRLTLNPPRGTTVATAILSRPRGRRVTVPGEVMPPYDPDEAIASTEVSDWESPPPSPPRPLLKLKQPKPLKEKPEATEKPPRQPREHATYRKPTPPPEDAELGSKYRPWTHLTEYEMYRLRKKMKKNHTWEPSDVMVRRELEARGRGWEKYYKARAEAQTNGTKFLDIDDRSQPKVEKPEAPITPIVVATPDPRPKTVKKPEPRKDKKADPARDRASLAAQEAELAARRLGDIGSAFKNLFSPLSSALASLNRSASTPTANKSAAGKRSEKTAKKRKLEEVGVSASPSVEPEHAKKKQKTAVAPKPSPLTTSSEPPQQSAGTIKIPTLKLNVAQALATSEKSTPATATSTRATRSAQSSVAPKTEESTPPPSSIPASEESTAAPEDKTSTSPLPDTSASASPSVAELTPAPRLTPVSVVPLRPSRKSNTPAATARQTPVMEASPKFSLPTAASRRPKREVPGTVTQSSQDGGAAVSVSQRKSKPLKQMKIKLNANTSSPEVRVDIDGRREIVDPDEERYCICGDVSYGEMICCEFDEKVSHTPTMHLESIANPQCQCEFGQWFHMDCVELAELPPRTIKWYCPGDRKKYHKGEHSNGLVGRGIK